MQPEEQRRPYGVERELHQEERERPLDGAPPLWAHSGTRALGWKKDGRWVAFYHQGSITDAWKDTHGGTSAESAEQSYQLGVNILAQAMAGYSEWKMMLEGKGGKK